VKDPGVGTDLDASLRRVHRSVLALLGVCALVVAAGAATETGESAPPPPAPYLFAAVLMALASVAARGPARGPAPGRGRLAAAIAALLFAAGIGLVGVALAFLEGLWRAALLYTVGGLLLALRPPPRFSDPPA
jgi:hypothetical protein